MTNFPSVNLYPGKVQEPGGKRWEEYTKNRRPHFGWQDSQKKGGTTSLRWNKSASRSALPSFVRPHDQFALHKAKALRLPQVWRIFSTSSSEVHSVILQSCQNHRVIWLSCGMLAKSQSPQYLRLKHGKALLLFNKTAELAEPENFWRINSHIDSHFGVRSGNAHSRQRCHAQRLDFGKARRLLWVRNRWPTDVTVTVSLFFVSNVFQLQVPLLVGKAFTTNLLDSGIPSACVILDQRFHLWAKFKETSCTIEELPLARGCCLVASCDFNLICGSSHYKLLVISSINDPRQWGQPRRLHRAAQWRKLQPKACLCIDLPLKSQEFVNRILFGDTET